MHRSQLIIGTGVGASGEPARKSKQQESTMTEHTEEGRDRLVDDYVCRPLRGGGNAEARRDRNRRQGARPALAGRRRTSCGQSSSCRSTRARRSIRRRLRRATPTITCMTIRGARSESLPAVGVLIGLLMNRR
jgi:hypothetical protein